VIIFGSILTQMMFRVQEKNPLLLDQGTTRMDTKRLNGGETNFSFAKVAAQNVGWFAFH
jgi:hypothetical protein